MYLSISSRCILVCLVLFKLCEGQEIFTIGALFHEDSYYEELAFKQAIFQKNIYNNEFHFKANIHRVSKDDPFQVSKILCNMTQYGDGIVGIIGPLTRKAGMMAQDVSELLEIPHIQPYLKPLPEYRGKMNINFYPDPVAYADALAALLRRMDWKGYTIIYEDIDGLIRLQEILQVNKKSDIPVTIKQLGSDPDYRPLLKEVKNSTVSHIVLDCHVDKILSILKQAKEIGMLEIYNGYLLTSLDAHTLDFSVLETTANITTLRMIDPKHKPLEYAVRNWEVGEYQFHREFNTPTSEVKMSMALVHDATAFFMEGFSNLHITQKVVSQPLSCDSNNTWSDGLRIIEYLKNHDMANATSVPATFELRTETQWFDEVGRRRWFQLQVVEIINGTEKVTGFWDPSNGNKINITRSESDQQKSILMNLQKTTVIVSSRIGHPYLMKREEKAGEKHQGNDRYEGYSMDLIREIAKELNFTFRFELTADGNYGKYDPVTKKWNGLVKDLLDKKAHLAICDLTITHQRREAVDFSMPFMTLGVSILHRKPPAQEPNIFAFMNPLDFEVWIYIATLYLGTSLALYVIARMAPGDWENPHPCNQNPEELENIWTVKNCLWLNLGSIMQQGCDILPKGISSRMGASLWWFFSLIITSSYTANLAAFLTTDKLMPTIGSAEALAKQTRIKYGLVEGGATESFFRETNFTTYSRMWTQMTQTRPSVFEKDNIDGVKRVMSTKNQAYAFLMESSSIEYEIERNCELKQVGGRLDSKGYGIAMPMNSPYRGAINGAILKLQESGVLQELKDKWWKHGPDVKKCHGIKHSSDSQADALALANVGGVFLVLGVGIGVAIGIAFLEFLWNVRNVSVEEHISYCEALWIEIKFAVNICNTKKRVKPILDSSSSSSSAGSETKSIAQRVLQGAGSFLHLDVLDRLSVNKQATNN